MEKFSPGLKRSIFLRPVFCAHKGGSWFLQVGRPCADLAKIKDFCSTGLSVDLIRLVSLAHVWSKSAKLYFGAQFYSAQKVALCHSQSGLLGHFARSSAAEIASDFGIVEIRYMRWSVFENFQKFWKILKIFILVFDQKALCAHSLVRSVCRICKQIRHDSAVRPAVARQVWRACAKITQATVRQGKKWSTAPLFSSPHSCLRDFSARCDTQVRCVQRQNWCVSAICATRTTKVVLAANCGNFALCLSDFSSTLKGSSWNHSGKAQNCALRYARFFRFYKNGGTLETRVPVFSKIFENFCALKIALAILSVLKSAR